MRPEATGNLIRAHSCCSDTQTCLKVFNNAKLVKQYKFSGTPEICLNFLALRSHGRSLDFELSHHIFDVLSALCDGIRIMQTLGNTLCVSQADCDPWACAGGIVSTVRASWGLQRGGIREVVCDNQIVKRHTCFDHDGCSRDRQSDEALQHPPLFDQHSEGSFNCHSERTMVEGENTFISL